MGDNRIDYKELVSVKGLLDVYIGDINFRERLYLNLIVILSGYKGELDGIGDTGISEYIMENKDFYSCYISKYLMGNMRKFDVVYYKGLSSDIQESYNELGILELWGKVIQDTDVYKGFTRYIIGLIGREGSIESINRVDGIVNKVRRYKSKDLGGVLELIRGKRSEDLGVSGNNARIDGIDDDSKSLDDGGIDEILNNVEDISELVSAIKKRVEAVYRSCFELDRPYGMLYVDGLLSYGIDGGKVRLKAGANQGGKSVFENLYRAIIIGCGFNNGNAVSVATDLRFVPNHENLIGRDYIYYPGFMFKYALGIVDDSVYKTWGKFSKALERSLERRLSEIYSKGGFYENISRIENAYSFSILVLSYERGTGIKLRVSMPGQRIDVKRLEACIRAIPTYVNASITIVSVRGYQDVMDVQILQNEDEYLNKPSWAYKAMEVKIANGDAISLTDGVPMGRKVNGDIVTFQLDPSKRFMTFLAAGSGAGKGVLTLSILAAGVGSGIPIFYTDYKPDMANIFWDLEDNLGVKTYTYDGMIKSRANDSSEEHSLGYKMPESLRGSLGKYAGQIMYLKSVQLMCAMAAERAENGFDSPIMYVFDEIEAMQLNIKGLGLKVGELEKKLKPSKGSEASADYIYVKTLQDWIIEINANINTYANTTGRTSATFTLWIAQSPDYTKWNDMSFMLNGSKISLLGIPSNSNTVTKILGKGSTTSKYGLGGDGKKSVSEKELSYVTNNRHFGMYDGKTTDGADITVFKPFLTLNTDDLDAKCWTNGLGVMYGSESVSKEEYYSNVVADHPPVGEYVGKQGTHSGVGFYGLASMYCGGDRDKLRANLGLGYEYSEGWFSKVGLSEYYSSVADYIYDCSLDGLMFLETMTSFSRDKLNSVVFGSGSGDSDDGLGMYSSDSDDGGSEYVEFDLGSSDDISVGVCNSNLEGDVEEVDLGEYVIGGVEDSVGDGSDLGDSNRVDLGDIYSDINMDIGMGSGIDIDSIGIVSGDIGSDGSDIGHTTGDISNSEVKGTSGIQSKGERHRDIHINNISSNLFNGNSNTFNGSAVRRLTNLTDKNSIDCSDIRRLSFWDKVALKTPRGMDKYIANRFDRLLQRVLSVVSVDLITRVRVLSSGLYINGRYVNDGLGGGDNNVRFKDLVVFSVLFKRFFNLKELVVDESILDVLILEYGSLENVFNVNSRLISIGILRYGIDNKGTLETIKRGQLKDRLDDLDSDAKLRAVMEIGRLKGGKFDGDSLNSDSIEGLRISKSNLGKARQHLDPRNKVSFTKGLYYSTLGFLGGIVGGIGLAISSLSKKG